MLKTVVDTVLPPACIGCDQPVTEIGNLCADCFREITFIGDPACAICGLPFQVETEAGAHCAGCLAAHPAYSRARSATVYGGKSRDLILSLKHGDRTDTAPHLAEWLVRAGRELVTEDTIITAVPLHPSRLRHRKFNQSGLLASAVARRTGRPVLNNLIIRPRRTRSQGGLSRAGRHRNVTGAFQVNPRFLDKVQQAHIIVIDDVLTTGATVEAVARTLYRAGAADVSVLTLARVVISD